MTKGALVGELSGKGHEQRRDANADDGSPTTATLERSGERVEAGNRGAVGLRGDGRIGTRDVIPIRDGSWG